MDQEFYMGMGLLLFHPELTLSAAQVCVPLHSDWCIVWVGHTRCIVSHSTPIGA
jgi:hypothetical protein